MKPARVQLSRQKGWRMPPNTVSVARPTRWGNPFKVSPAIESHGWKMPAIAAADAVQLYREHITKDLARFPSVREDLAALRGKNLACWCKADQPCHADVLLELANR